MSRVEEEAVVPQRRDRHEADLGDLPGDVLAERAVDRLPDVVVVLEGEADVDEASGRHQRVQDRRGKVEELDSARAHLAKEIGVGAELVRRKQLHIEPAAGGLADAVQGFAGPHVDRVARILAGRELIAEFGRRAAARDQRDHRQRRGARQQRAAGQ